MSNSFKKFINTNGKTLSEIREIVKEMTQKTVKSIIRDTEKELQSEIRKKIREEVEDAEKTSKRAEKIPEPHFFETDKPQKDREELLAPDEIAYPHESIPDNLTPREQALIEKIFEMRKLRQITYNGYIVQRCAEVTFVMQGEFMSDVTDDYPRTAFFGMSMPMYAAMSNSQLRTYFTWRTDARRGKYRQTDKPYVLLYAYELLNKIGTVSSTDAFGKLLDLWENADFAKKYLDELMPRWIKDFYAFNNVSEIYPDINKFLKSDNISETDKAISEILEKNYKNKLSFLAENSAYDIKKSIFFTEENKPLFEEAAENVLNALDKFLTEKDIDIGTLLCGLPKKDHSWKPFDKAYVNLDRADGFHAVKISSSEYYCIRRGEPTLESFAFFPQRGFIGYILKSIEAQLRINTGFKRKIVPNANMLLNDLKNREKLLKAVSGEDFSDTIKKAVDDFCTKKGISPKKSSSGKSENYGFDYVQYTRKNIEIDVSKLAEIRAKSDETARKLIIEESPDEEFIREISEKISDEEFAEKITEYSNFSEELNLPQNIPENIPEEWQNFARKINPVQREILSILAEGKNADEFCRENNLLPETIFEEINCKAMETVLDIVIEHGEIIPDYLGIVKLL